MNRYPIWKYLLVFAAIVVLTAIGFYLYQRWKRNIFAEPNK